MTPDDTQEEEGGSVRGSPPMHLVLSVIPQRLGNIFSSKTMLNHHANRCLGMGEVLQGGRGVATYRCRALADRGSGNFLFSVLYIILCIILYYSLNYYK